MQQGRAQNLSEKKTPFNVFGLQTVEDEDTSGNPDEFLIRYNISGILITAGISEARAGNFLAAL